MKKTCTILIAVAALAGCGSGGVDRDGSRDLFISQIEESTGFKADADCIDKVFDQYSDDELKDFDEAENQDTAAFEEFSAKLIECVDTETG
ncbi:MAG: hypothetical protein HKN44_01185 [Ilumatobacter sp.]|nr:hypothetical protein [Ilumatobacter sp.]